MTEGQEEKGSGKREEKTSKEMRNVNHNKSLKKNYYSLKRR